MDCWTECGLTDWLTDWLNHWLTDWLSDLLTDSVTDSLTDGWMDGLWGLLTDWSSISIFLSVCQTVWLNSWTTVWLSDRLSVVQKKVRPENSFILFFHRTSPTVLQAASFLFTTELCDQWRLKAVTKEIRNLSACCTQLEKHYLGHKRSL